MITFVFLLYIALMIGIGLYAYRQTRDLSDYLLGGRRMGAFVSALSAGASDMSGWLLMGLPGYAYVAGMEATWLLLGLLVGTWANWRFTAERLRRATEACGDALTLPDYLERRFDDASAPSRRTRSRVGAPGNCGKIRLFRRIAVDGNGDGQLDSVARTFSRAALCDRGSGIRDSRCCPNRWRSNICER